MERWGSISRRVVCCSRGTGGLWCEGEGVMSSGDDTVEIMENFSYTHLPEALQEASKPFAELALWMVQNLPANNERYFGLRKLLESKDCAVRSLKAKLKA